MSSQPDAAADAADPGNLLLHRMRIRRLEGGAIRDAMLVVSGSANLRPFGPAVPIYLTPFQDGRGRPASGPLDGNGRRSLYLAVRRNFISPFLLAFDTPTPFSTVGRRTVSNVPAQALILMNDPFVHRQTEVWARKVLAEPGSAKERIVGMYQTAFARAPSVDETIACEEFLRRQSRQATEDVSAWTDGMLFNMKEFIPSTEFRNALRTLSLAVNATRHAGAVRERLRRSGAIGASGRRSARRGRNVGSAAEAASPRPRPQHDLPVHGWRTVAS